MQEIRCKKCGKLLYEIRENPLKATGLVVNLPKETLDYIESVIEKMEPPTIKTKCPRCKELNTNNV